MAKKEYTFDEICRDIKAKHFAPIYVLMGEEPFFIDKITDLLIENVLEESERDFNQLIFYGADTDGIQILNAARRFPMMSRYQLVVVREAQLIRDIEILSNYAKQPLESTIQKRFPSLSYTPEEILSKLSGVLGIGSQWVRLSVA